MENKIAIIGAGISGLLACKYCLSKGFNPIVFESTSSIGGVWTKTIETTKLQTPKLFYQFSDFPWPDSVTEDFPSHHQVFDYLQNYAKHFDLLKHIMLESSVVGIEYEGFLDEEISSWSQWGGNGNPFGSQGKWKVQVVKSNCPEIQVYHVDFVILCIGRYSGVPKYPEFLPNKGPEAFNGKVIHSMDYAVMDFETATNFVRGKHVAIVGFQKFALDIAMEASAVNSTNLPCTVIYKTEHWSLPDVFPWGVPLAFLYSNRFSELLVHKPGQGFLLGALATVLAPLRWGISKFVESHIKRKLKLAKFGMVPEHNFLQAISSCAVATVPEKFYDNVEKGSIILKKAPSLNFCADGILIGSEAVPLKTDLVILATGFEGEKKLKDIFINQSFKDSITGSPKAAVPLYRECVHPRIPQLAVIGFSESISNLYTSEIRCRWLAEFLNGKFMLPSIQDMEQDVSKWDKYFKQSAGRYYRRSSIAALHIWYNDQLCKDMGWNPKRKKSLFAELFQPYGPMDYTSP